MRILILSLLLLSSYSQAQNCATPTQCYEMNQQRKADAIRIKQEREEAAYRQKQIEIQNAQLSEMQEQRAVMEEELEEMNATQTRMEEMKVKEMKDEAKRNEK